MNETASWLAWLREVDPAIYGVIAMFGVPILLLIYRARYHAARRQGMSTLLATLGFRNVARPSAEELIPELLLYPNKLGVETDEGGWEDIRRRLLGAWQGHLGPRPVILMEVSIDRMALAPDIQHEEKTIQHPFNQTVLRHDPEGEDRPPDLLVQEQVAFKDWVHGAREFEGSKRVGGHYFVYSHAPQDELERWITPQFRDALHRHRLWRIAVHGGVVYLARGRSRERPSEIASFLEEGEDLLAGLLATPRESRSASR